MGIVGKRGHLFTEFLPSFFLNYWPFTSAGDGDKNGDDLLTISSKTQ